MTHDNIMQQVISVCLALAFSAFEKLQTFDKSSVRDLLTPEFVSNLLTDADTVNLLACGSDHPTVAFYSDGLILVSENVMERTEAAVANTVKDLVSKHLLPEFSNRLQKIKITEKLQGFFLTRLVTKLLLCESVVHAHYKSVETRFRARLDDTPDYNTVVGFQELCTESALPFEQFMKTSSNANTATGCDSIVAAACSLPVQGCSTTFVTGNSKKRRKVLCFMLKAVAFAVLHQPKLTTLTDKRLLKELECLEISKTISDILRHLYRQGARKVIIFGDFNTTCSVKHPRDWEVQELERLWTAPSIVVQQHEGVDRALVCTYQGESLPEEGPVPKRQRC